MRRALIFLYFDPQGEVDDSTLHTIEGFRPLMDRILVVSNGELSSGAAARFNSVADDLLVRENTGFDVGAYRDALNAFGWDELRSYDQLTLANYTFFGPISSFAPVYERMENSGVDFWGITDHPALAADSATGMAALPAHLQSYWLTLGQRLINSDEFRQYWTEINDPVSYEEVIATFDDDIALVVIAKHLEDAELYSYEAISAVKGWLGSSGLTLAEEKRKWSSSPNAESYHHF